MKILLISPYIPYPPITGGKVRVLNFLKNMYGKHEVVLLCLLKSKKEFDDIEEVRKYCSKVIPVLRRDAWSLKNLLRTVTSRYPFLTVVNNFSPETEEAILQAVAEEKPDVVHLETFYMAQSLLAVKSKIGVPVILSKVDVEAQVYFRNAKVKGIFNPLKYIGYFDAWKMLRYEIEVCEHFDAITAASKVDRELLNKELQKRGVEKKISIIPNGVDCGHFKRNPNIAKTLEPSVIFVGNFRYFANTDAAFYFYSKIWFLVKKEVPKAKLYIIGPRLGEGIQRVLSGDVGSLAGEDVVVTDYVPEEEKLDYLNKSWACIAPLRVGSGTKLKILESMAMGLAVVATNVGIEGIDVKNNESVFIRDDPRQFADSLVSLLKNESLRTSVGQKARLVMEKQYDWIKISEKLIDVYREALVEGKS